MCRPILIALLLLMMIAVSPATAQHSSSGAALGAVFGSPSGIGLRLDGGTRQTYDFVAAWDLNDFFFVNGHLLFDKALGTDPRTTLFYGPGLFVGIRDRHRDQDNETVFGVSAAAGISFRPDPFEIMLRLTPRVSVVPDTRAYLGGGLGVYYWF